MWGLPRTATEPGWGQEYLPLGLVGLGVGCGAGERVSGLVAPEGQRSVKAGGWEAAGTGT